MEFFMSHPLAASCPCDPVSAREGDQCREYFIPASNVREEQKLLEAYAQTRLTDALRGIYTDFYLLIELMRGYAQSREDQDVTYFLLAEKLQQPLDRLNTACSATADWTLMSRKTVGVEP